MNKTQTEATKDKLKGNVKEKYGALTGNETKQAEGKMDKIKGNVKEKVGDAKEALSKGFNDKSEKNK
ncbi:uncharacterized protein YjbJ (UPF0337 family) [Cytobacillus horneckiae]|uniref:CsbD family protein n=1 Tax=Cytobacillus horneckiae TaxID=549687 RepID=A0A2N0Z9B8_9BACI|nr:CsbD family protein [Cytobacillus horneckiae]MBN6886580.1 CsbD family protein [Cytobacillus horneckiae]MCM3177951.1 CsbD family protein [Cytobacillus horneckiae]MEC1159201.1 CsbD family protein [Cytobacillus horneckiae]MED2935888.1 CsbD family protein [Cytobacillus horneckiae]PKG26101.1 CsbD family protein [Cytobacillus horneckiae]